MRLTNGAVAAGAAVLVAMLVTACGGGGGNPGKCSASAQTCAQIEADRYKVPSPSDPFPPPETYANICTPESENQFTQSYMNEVYLWYDEMPVSLPSALWTVPDYFHSLLTPELDPSGRPKNRFSFIVSNTDADSLSTGANVGYGVHWRNDSQGRVRVAYVDAGSPAAAAGLQRGGQLVDLPGGSADFFPNSAATVTFGYQSTPGAATQTVTLATAGVQEDPVPLVQTLTSPQGRRMGYVLFNAHTTGAQDELISAIKSAQAANVQDLVLDMRYNGGGFLYTAITLGSMITGPAADGQVFEKERFNAKLAPYTTDFVYRVTGSVQYGEQAYKTGAALPRLGLPRLYVLATGNTCSASEAVVNGLRGLGVEVNLIGDTTCGKPYGFYRQDNCGFSYYAIEFQGVNAQGFGDYPGGFGPTCAAADDFEHPLGSASERLLSTAMYHADHGNCPAQPMAAALGRAVPAMSLRQEPMRGKILPRRP